MFQKTCPYWIHQIYIDLITGLFWRDIVPMMPRRNNDVVFRKATNWKIQKTNTIIFYESEGHGFCYIIFLASQSQFVNTCKIDNGLDISNEVFIKNNTPTVYKATFKLEWFQYTLHLLRSRPLHFQYSHHILPSSLINCGATSSLFAWLCAFRKIYSFRCECVCCLSLPHCWWASFIEAIPSTARVIARE